MGKKGGKKIRAKSSDGGAKRGLIWGGREKGPRFFPTIPTEVKKGVGLWEGKKKKAANPRGQRGVHVEKFRGGRKPYLHWGEKTG